MNFFHLSKAYPVLAGWMCADQIICNHSESGTPLLSPQALLTTTGIILTVGAGGWHTAWEENLVQLLFHCFRGSLVMRWMPFVGVVYGEINPVMKGLCRSLIKLCYYLSTVCSVGDAVSLLI